jgi:hypothetical protein
MGKMGVQMGDVPSGKKVVDEISCLQKMLEGR